MDCVCGCGREIEGVMLTQRNFVAASVALELLAWDKNRASPTPGPDGREGLIARGADCYQRLLYSLHEEGGGDPDADCEEWLRESGVMRLQRSDMNKKQWLLGRGSGTPNLSEHDMSQLDRLHPELSFTGKVAARSGGPEAPVERAGRPTRRTGRTSSANSSACGPSATTASSPRTSSPPRKRACSPERRAPRLSPRRPRRRSASPVRPSRRGRAGSSRRPAPGPRRCRAGAGA